MPWGRVDDGLHANGKVWLLSDRAFRIWWYSVSYCNAKRGRDPLGRLTQAEAEAVCRLARTTTAGAIRRIIAELVAPHPPLYGAFWERDGQDYVVHDFPDYGPKLDLTAAERQRRRRGKSASHADVTRDSHADVTHPVPVPGPVPHEASSLTKRISPEETARAPEPIERARALAVPKPDLMSPHERSLSTALAAALGCAEPTTTSEARRWLGAIREMVHAAPAVTQAEVPRLVQVFEERNSVPCTPQGIVNQLEQLRGGRPAPRQNGRPKREGAMAQAERIARSRLARAVS